MAGKVPQSRATSASNLSNPRRNVNAALIDYSTAPPALDQAGDTREP
jgi:hypothetical protein